MHNLFVPLQVSSCLFIFVYFVICGFGVFVLWFWGVCFVVLGCLFLWCLFCCFGVFVLLFWGVCFGVFVLLFWGVCFVVLGVFIFGGLCFGGVNFVVGSLVSMFESFPLFVIDPSGYSKALKLSMYFLSPLPFLFLL